MNARYPIALLVASLLAVAPLSLHAQDAPPPAPAQPPAPEPAEDRAALEEKFVKTMSGCTLVGFFSDSNQPDKAPVAERYTITKVTKLKGDYYTFNARIQFGKRDVSVPLMIPVKWAGDTPVISVTNLGIPGMGSYTARVIIYGDQYAGTWSGTNHGGHLWGKIERMKAEEAPPAKAEPTPADENK